jgi:putative ATP-dependent endonuclease of OLD family
LPVYLERAGLDVLREGIAVIPVMGKGNLAKWWRFFFRAFELPVYVVFDNDAEEDGEGKKRTDVLSTMGVSKELIALALASNEWLVTEDYCVFGVDFETTLRSSFAGYEELEQEARAELGGESKPLMARYVAERLRIEPESPGRQQLMQLAKNLGMVIAEQVEAARAN